MNTSSLPLLLTLTLLSPACLFVDSSETNNGIVSNNGSNNGGSNNSIPNNVDKPIGTNNGIVTNNGITNNGIVTNNGNPPARFENGAIIAYVEGDAHDVDIAYSPNTKNFAIARGNEQGFNLIFLDKGGVALTSPPVQENHSATNISVSAYENGFLVGTESALFYCDQNGCDKKADFTDASEVMASSGFGVAPETSVLVRYDTAISYGLWDHSADQFFLGQAQQGDFSNLQILSTSRGFVATAVDKELVFFNDASADLCPVDENIERSRGIRVGNANFAIFGDNNDQLRIFSCTNNAVHSPDVDTTILAYDLSPSSQGFLLTSFAFGGTVLAQDLTATVAGGVPSTNFDNIGSLEVGETGDIEKIESARSGDIVVAVLLKTR